MLVKEVMSKKPDFIDHHWTLKQAADEMLRRDIGFIPIGGDNDRLIGVLTDRDIAIRAVARGKDPVKTEVTEAMSPNVYYCYDDDDVKKAAQYMSDQQIRRLVVLNHDKRIIGIVSLGDIALKLKDEKLAGHILHEVCEPETTH